MEIFGKELILDLHNCDTSKFTRKHIRNYFKKLCELIDMVRETLTWWDYYGVPKEDLPLEEHLRGISAVQFIRTSNITIHTLDLTGDIYLNIFSCKDYDENKVKQFSKEWFRGKITKSTVVDRFKGGKNGNL